jgi:GGDEF domain-containing protein
MSIFRKKNNENVFVNGFYSGQFFNMRLIEERRRSERTGKSFSIICVDFSCIVEKETKNSEVSNKKLKDAIKKLFNDNCRASDIKTWDEYSIVKIILPETSENDAKLFKKKLLKEFNNGFKTKNKMFHTINLDGKVNVTTYPDEIKNII